MFDITCETSGIVAYIDNTTYDSMVVDILILRQTLEVFRRAWVNSEICRFYLQRNSGG